MLYSIHCSIDGITFVFVSENTFVLRKIHKNVATRSVFTALHVMQTRYCDEISVRLSVRHTREL